MKIEMGIGWVPSKTSPGHVQSATPGEYAAEIVRLETALKAAHDALTKSSLTTSERLYDATAAVSRALNG